MLPLEDSVGDIVGKVMRGLHLGQEELARLSGLSARDIGTLLSAEAPETMVHAAASALHLDGVSLADIASKRWHPGELELPRGLACSSTDYNGMLVNAYLIWDTERGEGAVFDTGADATDLLDFISEEGIRVRAIFLTHTHTDHVADIARLKKQTKAMVYVHEKEAVPNASLFRGGESVAVGGLLVQPRLTAGHSAGSSTFVVSGLSKPVAVVGDALFAGSIGGPNLSLMESLGSVRTQILSLPPKTILCPGHGPMTTVQLEKEHNPFFAGRL